MSDSNTHSHWVSDPHALPVNDVLEKLSSGQDGLTEAEATRRLETAGLNRLPAGVINRLEIEQTKVFSCKDGQRKNETAPLTPSPACGRGTG